MNVGPKHILVKSILLAIIFSVAFWTLESAAHMFYFNETFEYFLTNEPLKFMDAFITHVPKYSLLIRLSYVVLTLLGGIIIGYLLQRDQKKTISLLSRERDYHEAINAVNEGIFNYITGTDHINASEMCYSILGYEKEEVPNTRQSFYELLAPESRDFIKKSLEKHIAEGKSFSFEIKMLTKSKRWKWIQLKGNVHETNEDGSSKRIMGIFADIDKQVKTSNKLKNYTACLEEAEKVAHVGHWEFDYKSRKVSWSKEVFNILEIPHSTKIADKSRRIIDYVHPEDRSQTVNVFLKSIRHKTHFDCSFRLQLKDKSIKYISQRGHHVFDGDGKLLRSFGTIQDVTESSLANQALTNSEKRYRTLFENVYQGIIIIDPKTEQIKLANKVFCKLFGYTEKEVLNCRLKDLHPGDNFDFDAAWIKVKDKSFLGNVNCLRKDGFTFPAEVYASNVILEKHSCVIAIFRDLTESYQMEYDRHMLKLAVDNSDVEIMINCKDGSFDYCSPALATRLGYTYDEMKKMHIWDIEDYFTQESFKDFWKSITKNKSRQGEGIEIAKDGTRFEINYVSDFVKIGDRELMCTRIQDITESKKREAIMENAKKKAEESDRLKTIFLANMSHEIRTPMNGILGFADLLQRNDLSLEKSQQYAKIISQCGNNLMQLLDDILDFSKIEAGQLDFKKEDLCVNKIIEELYDFHALQARQNNSNISLHMHKSLRNDEAMIHSDERHLKQILTNLLNNALKFTEKGEIVIGYNAKRNGIEFFVKDSGCGIAADMLDKIFEPFRQGEEILARKHHGSGLGLTIAKSYVEALGGYIWVESELNKGTTFCFTLPYSKNTEVKIARPAALMDLEFNWEGKNILVVEDNRVSYMLLENLLENNRANVHHAETAQESVDKAEELSDLDLVLMDVRLPDFTGWEASKIIKKSRPDLPIIIQTANATEEDKIKTFQSGCNAYLPKPIIKKKFYTLLDKFLNCENYDSNQ